jgi:tetratricopeptide (TPR) repeat protein
MAGLLQQGDGYFAAGQYDRAEIEYANALRIDPRNPQAIGRLGIIYFDQGRMEWALPRLLQGRELRPDNLELRRRLGWAYLSVGKNKEARDEAIFILGRDPQDAEAPLLLAKAADQPQDMAAAQQRLLALSKPAAESSSVLAALGLLGLRQHLMTEADAYVKRAQQADSRSSAADEALGIYYWARRDLPQAEQAFAAAAEASPPRSARRLEYAEFKIKSGDFAAGRRLLEAMTQKAPDYLPAWMQLAQMAESEKKYDESAALVAKVLARDPTHPEGLLLHSRLSLEKGEASQATAELEGMLKLYPQSPQVYYQLGLTYLVGGETAKASASLSQASRLAPHFVDPVIVLAGIQIRTGETGLAIASLRQVVEQHPEILRAWLLLAAAYRSANDFDQALAVYDRLEPLFPHDPQASWLKGLLLAQQNKPDQARQSFNRALAAAPDYQPALEQLIDLDLAEKQYTAALHRVQSGLEKNPNLPGLHLLLAKIYLAQKDAKHAEASLSKVIALQPGSSPAYILLAQLYAGSNEQPKALADLQAGLARNPNDVQALMLMGMIYDQQKAYADERATYEKLLAINPDFVPAINNLAYLYSEHLGRLDRAYALAQKAWERLPPEPHLEDTLGWILFKQRQYARALSRLEESAGKLPTAADVQFHLGLTHYMMGEETPARLALQNALQLGHDFSGRNEAEQCLSVLAIDPHTAGSAARAILEKALADRPGDPAALARLAVIYERAGAVDQAIGAYRAVEQANPANLGALMNLVRLYAAQKNTAQALALAKNARQLAPDDPEVAHALGRLADETGDHPWALSLLQETVHQKPDDPEVLYDLAEAYYSMGRVDDAQAALGHSLQAGTSFSRAANARRFLELIDLSTRPEQASSAIAKVKLILQADPDDLPALVAMAEIDEHRSDLRAARQDYEKVLEHDPDFVPAKKSLALLAAKNPDVGPKALDQARQARAALPEDGDVTKAFGIIAYRSGDYAEAEKALQLEAGQRDGDAELMYYLGMTQCRLKQRAEGKHTLERALALKLEADLAAEARRTLADPNP